VRPLWQDLCRSLCGQFPILSSEPYHCFCLWRRRGNVSASASTNGEGGDLPYRKRAGKEPENEKRTLSAEVGPNDNAGLSY
jgi:hypothetical protein